MVGGVFLVFSNTMIYFFLLHTHPAHKLIVYLSNVHIIFLYLKECYAWHGVLKFLNSNNKENYVGASRLKDQVIFPVFAFQMKAVFVVHWSCFHRS